jgi:hypothetical protein
VLVLRSESIPSKTSDNTVTLNNETGIRASLKKMTHMRKLVLSILSTESYKFLVIRVLHKWQLIAVVKKICLVM